MKCGIGNDLFFPRFAILDPLTTMSLPERQTINGVVDAFVHVCEQYLTTCRHADVQDRYAEALLRVLIDNGRLVMKEPNSYVARANIMWASTQALNHWIDCGVDVDWATHFIGHELTAYLGMDHGRTLACIQPRVLEYNFEAKKAKLAQMGRRVFDLEGDDEEEIARKCIQCIVDFYEKDMHQPTHISAYIQDEDRSWIQKVVEKFTKQGVVWGENQFFTPEISGKVINDSY
jgi:NADP-dependent alcohol dehydrogenase